MAEDTSDSLYAVTLKTPQAHPVAVKLLSLLAGSDVKFDLFEHDPVRTSEEASKIRSGYSLSQGAKALVVKVVYKAMSQENTGNYLMLVIPGDMRFSNKLVKQSLKLSELRFASEGEVSDITNGVQVGGVPPFGSLFNIPTFVDPLVLKNDHIVFNAGDRRVSIGISSKDYLSIEKPKILSITE